MRAWLKTGLEVRSLPGLLFQGLPGSFRGIASSGRRSAHVPVEVAKRVASVRAAVARLSLADAFRRVLQLEFLSLELLEAEEGSGDLAVEGDFVAQEEFVGAHAFGGVAPGQDGAQRRVIGGRGRGYLMVEGDFLHSPDAPLTPAGGGDVFDQEFLGGSARVVFLKEALDQFEERPVSSASKTMVSAKRP